MKIKILIPVYNDWQSVFQLLKNIDKEISGLEDEISVIIVNDASKEPRPEFNLNLNNLKNHNLKKMLIRGLRVMINSDDPAYFGGYLNQNLIETQLALDLKLEEVKNLIINSFKSSFLEDNKKNEWIEKIT